MPRTSHSSGQRRGTARRAPSKRYLLVPAIFAGLALVGLPRVQAAEGAEGDSQNSAASPEGGSAVTLPSLTVKGEMPASPTTTVGSKMPLTLREIPQSVSVITRQRMEQQNIFNLEDAMQRTTGVVVERIDANRLNFYSRGFEIQQLQIDGLPTTMDDRVFLSPNLAMYQRVEVLRGPAGLLTGAGGAGGTINLVRKRPLGNPALMVKLMGGSWDNYRAVIDATSPLNGSGSLRGRVVGAYQDRNSYIDLANEKNALLYGVLEYDLTPSTLLTFGGRYQYLDARQPWTLPAFSDFTLLDVPRSTFLGADWNHDRFVSTGGFAELKQAFGNEWLAKLSLRYSYSNYYSDQAFPFALDGVDRGTNTTELWGAKFDYEQKQTGVGAYTTGPITLFGRKHWLLLGANYEHIDFQNPNFTPAPAFFPFPTPVNVFDPRTDFPRPTFTRVDTTTITERAGLYGNARISLADPLTVVLGGRVSWWQIEVDETGQPQQSDKYNAVFTPLVGLIYDLNDTYSLYASYAETFQAQSVRDIQGNLLDPVQSEQYEAGIKAALLDGALNASLAVFHLTQTNRPLSDPNIPPGQNVFVARGEVKNKGIEAEVSGQLLPGWNFYAGYTYLNSDDPTLGDTDGSTFSAIAPKHMLRSWTNYRLPGDWNPLSIGAGVTAVSKIYNKFEGGNRLTQEGYALVDARLGYRITENLSAALNVTNIFDKKYYQRINTINSGNLFGQPRAFMLTLRGQWW